MDRPTTTDRRRTDYDGPFDDERTDDGRREAARRAVSAGRAAGQRRPAGHRTPQEPKESDG
jgi:hypothetical protein